ncbi:MAG: hypothetical protein MK135_06620 [Polyangiaceae bacterium]|nr:hypothetical protein [Polyangiaceae bacterium]
MYDAWALFEEGAQPYLVNQTLGGTSCVLDESLVAALADEEAKASTQEEVMSFAAFGLLTHRFQGCSFTRSSAQSLMQELGYTSSAALPLPETNASVLGRAIADCYIEYGLNDGSNEAGGYQNRSYQPANNPLRVDRGLEDIAEDPNRWQPLTFDDRDFIDQSGNSSSEGSATPEFLSAEWGQVAPFALPDSARQELERDSETFIVYHDPGPPPLYRPEASSEENEAYRWNFSIVANWASHHDPNSGVMVDISPASAGGLEVDYESVEQSDYEELYRPDGPNWGPGHSQNPATGEPYQVQSVPLGDYTRVLAEFWADGPSSETPPGHWFVILNYVSDQPELTRQWAGKGAALSPLEWDVKAYFALGGALHDAAIAAWSIKGFYDYIRPISAIRYLGQAARGTQGLFLSPAYIRTITEEPSINFGLEWTGQAEIFTWRPAMERDAEAPSVGWLASARWVPYQPPNFITPPFAGYVSGHSTFSRAAAEILTAITGDPYFPGGLGEFIAEKDTFLEFERGPSEEIRLQWATYRDASDQTSLSRIWGGIHPPVDDIPGRRIGIRVAADAIEAANQLFGAN